MRTTIRLDVNLFRQLKQLAVETHRTLTAVIEDAVREVLARRKKKTARAPVRLPTFGGRGLQPGIDLNDAAGLLERMEER